MSTLREAAQQALEALENHAKQYPHMQKGYTVDAITALRAALAQEPQNLCDIAEDGVCEAIDCCGKLPQEEKEPVAWMVTTTDERHFIFRMNKPATSKGETLTALYTHPPSHAIEKAYESACKIIDEQDKKLAELDLAVAAQREKLAHWMRNLGYATGHGDTIEDLLDHLGTQIAEGLEAEVLMEREACAELVEGMDVQHPKYIAAAIRARSKT